MDYCVRLLSLPDTVPAVTVQGPDGFFSIYLNEHLDLAERRRALEHELAHLRRYDFSDAIEFSQAEAYRAGCCTVQPKNNNSGNSHAL